MIQIAPQMRILLAIEPVDFRKGIDGLVAVCRQALGSEPFEGALFVFRSRSRQALKLLMYDGQGFWLAQKRFSQGRVAWWPQAGSGAVRGLAAHQLQLLLWNGDPETGRVAPLWRPLPSAR